MHTKNNTSEIDTKCIELFKKFIENNEAKTVRKALTSVYTNYTQMLIENAERISFFNETELCHLSSLIEVLDGGYD